MNANEKLRDAGSNVYNNDDVVLVTRKTAKALFERSDISGYSTLNEKIITHYNNNLKGVFANLVELQKHMFHN